MKVLPILLFVLTLAGACLRNEDSLLNARAVYVDGLESLFELRNAAGEPSRVYSPGDSITFFYSLANRSSDARSWLVSDTRPFVTFEIWQGSEQVYSSIAGLAFAQVIVTGTLPAGNALALSMRLAAGDTLLPAGEYVARAIPQVTFDETGSLPELNQSFSVVGGERINGRSWGDDPNPHYSGTDSAVTDISISKHSK